MRLFLVLASVLLFSSYANGHGRLMDPISRGSAWREYPDLFPKALYDIEWCGYESEAQEADYLRVNPKDIRNVTCGVCGPIYNDRPENSATIFKPNINGGAWSEVFSFEKSSPIYRGHIVKTYTKGQTIDVTLKIAANHKGSVQFRIVNTESMANDPSWSQVDRNILQFENGEKEMLLNDGEIVDKIVYDANGDILRTSFKFRVQLPSYLTCNRCFFQWRWFNTGNGQKYFGCSDISIVPAVSTFTHV